VIGILEQFTGKGIGTQLFQMLEAWARSNDIHRLELTVMTHNERAIALYKKMGFEIEGIKKHSLFVNGEYVDEYYMAKLI
jgi:RimJ/RimL family protein N-acetyltransferase